MARITELTLEDGRHLAQRFSLEIAQLAAFDGGSVNSNFRLWTTDRESYFLRVYEEQGVDGARAEATLLSRLARSGVLTAEPLRDTRGEPVVVYKDKPIAIYPWVDGTILCHKLVTPEHCREVGAALADVHLASSQVGPLHEGRFGPEHLRARLDRIEAEASPELVTAAQGIRQELDRALASRSWDLPRGLIHGDLFRDNVLWNGNRIAALIDFESACEGTFLFDLLVCICAWCYGDDFDLQRVSGLVSGYQRRRPLEARELAALESEATFVCLRFATTRITDFSMRAAPGQAPGRDYRRFLARLAAIRSGTLRPVFGRIAD